MSGEAPDTSGGTATASRIDATARRWLFLAFFFGALLFLLWQLLRIFGPFFSELAAAATLVIIVHPLHARLERVLGGRRSLAAGISTGLVLVLVIVPVILLAWLVVAELTAMLPQARDFVASVKSAGPEGWRTALPDGVAQALARLETFVASWGIDVQAFALNSLDDVADRLSRLAGQLLRNAFRLGLDVAILGLSVFFFFRDGSRMVRAIVANIPMTAVHVERITQRLDSTLGAVVRGMFVTAVVQGIVAGLGFLFVGLPLAALAGFATALFALIPLVGAAAIWVPAAIYLFAVGRVGAGIFLVGWGIVVSLLDNVLKPLLIGGRTQVSTFLLFFGILGGLRVYGFLGILIGPVLIALVLTFLAIYREEYQPALRGDAPAPGA